MILAAGLGTRLRPLTNSTPKALVEVGGRPLLEHTARRLIDAGATRLIINLHHFSDQIRAFVASRDDFGVEVVFSDEKEEVLGTGGGIKHAAPHFRMDAPLFVHNADILSTIDLQAMYARQQASDALATLAVRPAETERYLIFGSADYFCGYANREDGREIMVRDPKLPTRNLDYCGVQVISPRLFELMHESGVFSIINVFVRLSADGERIVPHDIGDARWIDAGTHERLAQAREIFG